MSGRKVERGADLASARFVACASPRALDADLAAVLDEGLRSARRAALSTLAVAAIVAFAFRHAGAFELARYRDALPTLAQLAADAFPPDFRRWNVWGGALLETLSMSVAGTALGAVAALPLGALGARSVVRTAWVSSTVRVMLDALRAIPGLIWGVAFVAAVGFGPLSGVLALAVHSAGMLGKLVAETLEHVDPAPGDVLRSQGVGRVGVLRFAVFPQIFPRLVDMSIYRWEHNVRAATAVGAIGAGGLGLELVTAFHLFEYREAAALILVLAALVALINAGGARVRARLLGTLRVA